MPTEKIEHIITETTKIYPRGRGKVLVISEKAILKKPKNNKKINPSFLHSYIPSNPESIKVKEYMSNGIKRIVLFPEGKVLQREERLDLACSLLVTLVHIPETSSVRNTVNSAHFITKEVMQLCRTKLRRYKTWRNKNQD